VTSQHLLETQLQAAQKILEAKRGFRYSCSWVVFVKTSTITYLEHDYQAKHMSLLSGLQEEKKAQPKR
jgi:hypothetical protein